MKHHELPCYLVEDLLPLYADHLVAPQTEADIQAHLSHCKSCTLKYQSMTAPLEPPKQADDAGGIQFLKKERRMERRKFSPRWFAAWFCFWGYSIGLRSASRHSISRWTIFISWLTGPSILNWCHQTKKTPSMVFLITNRFPRIRPAAKFRWDILF